MTDGELKGLACAVSSWLGYRFMIAEKSVYEIMTLIPITEYLSASTRWHLDNEVSYREIFSNKELSDHWADIYATDESKKFVMETKLLRYFAKNRWPDIQADIQRLARPEGDIVRYFLLTGLDKYFSITERFRPEGDAKLFIDLLGFQEFQIDCPDRKGNTKRSTINVCADVKVPIKRKESKPSESLAPQDEHYRTVIWSIAPAI